MCLEFNLIIFLICCEEQNRGRKTQRKTRIMRNNLFVDVRVSPGSGREGGTLQEMGPMGSPCSFDPDSEIQLMLAEKQHFLPPHKERLQ